MLNQINLYLTLGGTALAAYFFGLWAGLAFYVACQICWAVFFLVTGTGLNDL